MDSTNEGDQMEGDGEGREGKGREGEDGDLWMCFDHRLSSHYVEASTNSSEALRALNYKVSKERPSSSLQRMFSGRRSS
jgi:hypothetical protein